MTAGTPAPQDAETELAAVEDAVFAAMLEHGPDGHVDGYQEITRAALAALAPVRAREVEAARRDGAREALESFAARQYEMAQAWGHDVTWLTTGTKVAALVADWALEQARDLVATHAETEES